MVKFETLVSTSSLTCLELDDKGETLLCARPGSHISSLLADGKEFMELQSQIKSLLLDRRTNPAAFSTFTLVFRAPGVVTESPCVNRSPINGGKAI